MGEIVTVAVPEPEPAEPGGESIPLDIVFEDDAIIVIDKPAGLVVHPAAGHATGTLVNALIAHCGDSLSGIGGVKRPGIVHRLDKDTTGLMVVAKTDRAHQALVIEERLTSLANLIAPIRLSGLVLSDFTSEGAYSYYTKGPNEDILVARMMRRQRSGSS